jgi:hypothetical protein
MAFANHARHFVHGLSGDRFPASFAHPPGKGLPSSTVNVAWGGLNLAIGNILFRVGKIRAETTQRLLFSSQARLQ